MPSSTSIAVLVNPTGLGVDTQLAQTRQAAQALGLTLHVLEASSERDLDAAFLTLVALRVQALVITADGLFADQRDQIIALSRRHSVPTAFQFCEFAAGGGLMTCGPRSGDSYCEAGILAAGFSKGRSPPIFPVKPPTIELAINMSLPGSLGLLSPFRCNCWQTN